MVCVQLFRAKSIHLLMIYFEKIEKLKKTVNIEASTVDIEERGVKLRLTIVDTPGFGDSINCSDWFDNNNNKN